MTQLKKESERVKLRLVKNNQNGTWKRKARLREDGFNGKNGNSNWSQ